MPKVSRKTYRQAKVESDQLLSGLRELNETCSHSTAKASTASTGQGSSEGIEAVGELCFTPDLSEEICTDFDDILSNVFDALHDDYDTDDGSDEEYEAETELGSHSTDLPESCDESCNDESFEAQLGRWAVMFSIKCSALTALLKLLRKFPDFSHLPSDGRSFLHTPRNAQLKDVIPGKYYHFGLQSCIQKLLQKKSLPLVDDNIEIAINIDGLPLAKSSGSQFYPILGSLFGEQTVDIVGLYHGYEKPKEANALLKDFVEEATLLTTNGVLVSNKTLTFQIKICTCDAPAKSYITYVKGHTGYSSCTKCYQTGEYISNRICFPVISNIRVRTDEEFASKVDEDYHLQAGPSLLETIPRFGMVSKFPLDYM